MFPQGLSLSACPPPPANETSNGGGQTGGPARTPATPRLPALWSRGGATRVLPPLPLNVGRGFSAAIGGCYGSISGGPAERRALRASNDQFAQYGLLPAVA